MKSNKRIINCAITGAIHSPTMSPYLPITPTEIAQQAIDAANAGAATVHIHARDPQTGKPSSALHLYQEIIDKIRAVNKEIIICITSGGGLGMPIEERVSPAKTLKPELASMNCGSINWGIFMLAEKTSDWKYDWEKPYYEGTRGLVFQNSFADMEGILDIFNASQIKPELECYDVGHLYNIKFMQDAGYIKGRPYLQFVLGINGGNGANIYELVNMKQTADRLFGVGGYEWSAFGAGREEYPICTQNLFLGGHVRVGLEDNLYLAKGKLAESNAQLVEKMVHIMREFGYEPASPSEAREYLDLI